jgi:hypothetical protein
VAEEVTRFTDGADQIDDITLLSLKAHASIPTRPDRPILVQ